MVCITTSILRLVALFIMAGAATVASAGTAAAIGTATTVAPLAVKTGNLDVTVGGTLNVAADQENGTYTGTFSVEVLYF
jgi:hypothetical protein